jgi:hypothetical protein
MRHPSVPVFFLIFFALLIPLKAYSSSFEDAIFQRAGELKQWADSAYRLSYSDDNHNSSGQFVGNLLRALDLQEVTVKTYLSASEQKPSIPVNNLQAQIALHWVESQLASDCRWCRKDEDWRNHRATAHAFMVGYDLRGIGSSLAKSRRKFSGFPFYGDVVKAFGDPEFRSRVILLEKKLEDILVDEASGDDLEIHDNIFSLATGVCNGDKTAAMDLLGILLSRDSNIVHFFNFSPETNPEFAKAVARTPLMVRLLSSLDQVGRHSSSDRFSFDGVFETTNIKNYYFWSGVFISKKLKSEGYTEKAIHELSLLFPRAYKSLRKLDDMRLRLKSTITGQNLVMLTADEFLIDAKEVMRMSGRGSLLGTRAPSCDDLLLKK